MNITGIIAEYNPFHNGHAYHIQKAREETNADYVVVVMSGDYVQRGTPAIVDKYLRSEMALNSGADLIIELPVLWSTASAEYFAHAAVSLLDQMGCVDYLSFGAESTNLALLSSIADVLLEEPRFYKASLNAYLKNGLPFPLAREMALSEYFDASEEISDIVRTPNNILAIEYLKALKLRKSKITPHIVKRQGAGYHEEAMSPSFSSATGIRKCLEEIDDTTIESDFNENYLDNMAALSNSMPQEALRLLCDYTKECSYVKQDDFSLSLHYKMLQVSDFSEYADCSQDLSNRITNQLPSYINYTQFWNLLKSKELTYSRISRVLLHILLDIRVQDYNTAMVKCDYVPYLRVLGFRKAAAPLLTIIKQKTRIPLITKMADAAKQLKPNAERILNLDIFAANLYESILTNRTETVRSNEYNHGLIMLTDSEPED